MKRVDLTDGYITNLIILSWNADHGVEWEGQSLEEPTAPFVVAQM